MFLDQSHYIKDLLLRFNLVDAKPCKTPMEVNAELIINKGGDNLPNVPYHSLVGSLLYIANCTRPDIAHAVGVLSQFNSCYTQERFVKAKRVLRYLKGSMDLRLEGPRTQAIRNSVLSEFRFFRQSVLWT